MNPFANNIQFLNASTMPNFNNNNNQFNISLGPPNNAIESIKNEFKIYIKILCLIWVYQSD